MSDSTDKRDKEMEEQNTGPDIMALITGDIKKFLKSIPEDDRELAQNLKKIYMPVPDPENYPPEFVKIQWETKMVRADIVAERQFNDLKRRLAEKAKHFKDEKPENPNQ